VKNKLLIDNRKANYEYTVIKTIEAGIVLQGFDAKGIRNGYGGLNGSFAKIINSEVFLFDFYVGIQPCEKHSKYPLIMKSHEAQRQKKLLLHKKEIFKLQKFLQEPGNTLIPLSVYTNERNIIKIELGLCKGKKEYDKKQAIKERDLDRFEKSLNFS